MMFQTKNTHKETAPQKESGRIVWLDDLKGFLILFVLLSHSYPPIAYRRFFTPFFLTMFFFVSGYTFSVKDRFPLFFVKKCKRLVLPLFLLGGIRMSVSFILYDRGKGMSLFLERLKGLLLQRSGHYDEMWFISCLFVSCMIFYGILTAASKISSQSKMPVLQNALILLFSFCCLLAGFFVIYGLKVKLPWETELALIMTMYTATGYLYRQYEKAFDTHRKTFILLLSVVFYTFCVPMLGDDIDIHMEKFASPVLFLFLSFLITFPVLYLCKALSRTMLNRPLSFLGQNTLFYFAFGGFIRILFYAAADRMGLSNEFLLSAMCALVTAALLALPAHLVHERLPWLIGLSGRKHNSSP